MSVCFGPARCLLPTYLVSLEGQAFQSNDFEDVASGNHCCGLSFPQALCMPFCAHNSKYMPSPSLFSSWPFEAERGLGSLPNSTATNGKVRSQLQVTCFLASSVHYHNSPIPLSVQPWLLSVLRNQDQEKEDDKGRPFLEWALRREGPRETIK